MIASAFRRFLCLVLFALFALGRTELAATTVSAWSPLFKGVDYATATNSAAETPGPLKVFALRMALHEPGVSFTTTPSAAATYPGFETFSQTTGDFVTSVGGQAGINANFFSTVSTVAQPQNLSGLAIANGQVISQPDPNFPALVITQDNVASITTTPVGFNTTQIWTAVAGSSIILENGTPVNPPAGTSGDPFNPNPRSAVGISQDGAYLYLMVIDGRTTTSVGVTQQQTGAFLALFGAYTGLNLDGGGSSALVQSLAPGVATVLNAPSGGTQRLNGNNLAVFAAALPPTLPSVTLTSPLNNASYTFGAAIPLAATASDPDGFVSKVEFYQGGTKLGEDTVAPYTFTWANAAIGGYALTAVVTDNDHHTVTSAPINLVVTGAVASGGPYSDFVLNTTPTAYYKLDETSGTVVTDSSGNGRHGTYPTSGTTKGNPDKPIATEAGTSVTFNGGANVHLTVPYQAALNPGGSFSVEAWGKPSVLAGAFQALVSSRDDKGSGSAGNAGFILYSGPADSAAGDRWQFWIGGDTAQTYNFLGRNRAGYGLGPVVALNQWTHVVGTYAATSGPDGTGRYTGTQTLYINGAVALTRANVKYLPNPNKPLYIGAGSNELITSDSLRWTGNIDAVSLYGTALTAAQVKAHYDAANVALDLDGDRLPNGLEYALATPANVPNRAGLPTVAVATEADAGKLAFTFNRARGELSYIVQGTDDLKTWTNLATNPGNPGATVTYVDANTTSPNRFLRLSVAVSGSTFTTTSVGRMTYSFAQNQETAASFPLSLVADAVVGQPAGFITGVGASTLSNANANWAPGFLSQAAAPYFVRITSGAAAGRVFDVATGPVSQNTATQLTLVTRGVDLTTLGIALGTDTYELVPADTLANIFPAGTFQAGSVATGDSLRLWTGSDFATFTFDGEHWHGEGSLADERVGRPNDGWMVRRRGATTNFVLLGQVSSTDAKVPVARGATHYVSLLPVAQTFAEFPLQTLLPGWSSNPANPTAGDHVRLWNGSAWLVFYHNGTKWLRQGAPADAGSTVLLKPGRPVFIVRPSGIGTDLLPQVKPY